MDKNKINDGGPAFPGPYDYRMDGSPIWGGDRGMTLRDWFAGQALNAWLSSNPKVEGRAVSGSAEDAEALAGVAYVYADAMLAARSKKQEGQQ